ncbi:competence protein ComEC [Halalkaliarchaeum desulfuricum]|uniref:Competence protein ComEC n=1 Tax=Halalkaliarchaeum desulfuricum TaxID=2055893 RepID=A0A343TLF9_9EURY|nr:ComEC/Rec2 family competence protein [Halalkaliarchaeum desulfuricum]AUX09931.1 competence protein ComEC [Halalkaliarchaeum desulfuricum]
MRRLLLVLALAGILLLAGCAGTPGDWTPEPEVTPTPTPEPTPTETPTPSDEPGELPDGEFQIHHIDVGQADATLIITPDEETILIDTGDWRQDGQGVLEYLKAHEIDRIDHLVATHGHADHIGGHAAIIEHYETERDGIGAAYDNGVAHTSQTYENYLDAVEEHDVELLFVEDGDEIPIADGTVDAQVLNPPAGDSGSDLHENSIVLSITFGEVGYLTTGDAETKVESRLVEERADALAADVYHAGHHGSSTSSSESFLDTAEPSIAVISSAYDSQYGHPHDEVLERFADRGIETYWTGVHGDIVITTDGEEIAVETSEEFSTDPADLLAEKPNDDDGKLAPPPLGVSGPILEVRTA